jgi:hypothetical protein
LERLVRAFTTRQQLALRARIIVLLAGDGWNLQIARELGVDDETSGKWRKRWLDFAEVPPGGTQCDQTVGGCAETRWAAEAYIPEQIYQIIALA